MSQKENITHFISMIRGGEVSVPHFVQAAKDIDHISPSIALAAYNGSIDSARKLHDIYLGKDWEWTLSDINSTIYWKAENLISENNNLPSRAWVIAILQGLIFKIELNE